MRELYKAKGYSDEWIEKRVRGIAIRDELTNEWVYTVMLERFCPASIKKGVNNRCCCHNPVWFKVAEVRSLI